MLRLLAYYYRRHPLLAIFLVLGLTLGTSLLVGVLALTEQTQQHYEQNTQSLKQGPSAYIRSKNQEPFAQTVFITLRQQGFHQLAPMLSGTLSVHILNTEQEAAPKTHVDITALAPAQRLSLLGTDLLSMPSQTGAQKNGNTSASSAQITDLFLPPFTIWLNPQRAKQLGLNSGDRLYASDGSLLAPIHTHEGYGLGHRGLVDIGYAQSLLQREGLLDEIAVFHKDPKTLDALSKNLPDTLALSFPSTDVNPDSLAGSLRLNLRAMSLLAFAISSFLVYNAIMLNHHHRQRLFAQARLCGLSLRHLYRWWTLELFVFASIAACGGSLLGWYLATEALPLVGRTLAQFEGRDIAYQLSFDWKWFYLSLASAGLACFISHLALRSQWQHTLPKQLAAGTLQHQQQQAQQQAQQTSPLITSPTNLHSLIKRCLNHYALQLSLWGSLLMFIAGMLWWFISTQLMQGSVYALYLSFAVLAAILLGAALLLPALLQGLLRLLQVLLKSLDSYLHKLLLQGSPPTQTLSTKTHTATEHAIPKPYFNIRYYLILMQWLVADSQRLIRPSGIALMAMVMALVANTGMNLMVNSFRQATDDWLSQRLVADLYVRAEPKVLTQIMQAIDEPNKLAFINKQNVDTALRYEHTINVKQNKHPLALQIRSLPQHAVFQTAIQLTEKQPHAWQLFNQQLAIFVSEQTLKQQKWQLNEQIPIQHLISHSTEALTSLNYLSIAGVYQDYGNPSGQILLTEPLYLTLYPEQKPESLALITHDPIDVTTLSAELQQHFSLNDTQLLLPHEIKTIALNVFDQTFTITHLLNGLTLLIASIGIACACATLEQQRSDQLTLLAAIGVNRRQRFLLSWIRWGLLALLSLCISWPFGLLLTSGLVYLVNPIAFGWSYPVLISGANWSQLALFSISCVLIASAIPNWRHSRFSLLKSQQESL